MAAFKKLGDSFYTGKDVVKIAKQLLGKCLVTRFDGIVTSGRIVETEAYKGVTDRASHAYGGRRTRRTEVMFGTGGKAYVYLCYGIHHLFNVVTNVQNVPHAILIRAVEPMEGIEVMLRRTGKQNADDHRLTRGPGNVSRALGISKVHSGADLSAGDLFILDDGYRIGRHELLVTPRIGVGYAGQDAKLLYRFAVKGNPYVSGKNEPD